MAPARKTRPDSSKTRPGGNRTRKAAKRRSADQIQIGGRHYKKAGEAYQHWNLVLLHGWDYFQAQTIKYIMRYKDKNGVQDLKKAKHFLEKMIDTEVNRKHTRRG